MLPKIYMMKHLLALTALIISSLAVGQNDPFWNPDANGDDLIGFTDLASLLSVYNSSIGIDSSITCDFSGTDLEELIFNALIGEVVIDSMYFESTLSGIATDYTIGCPNPVETPWSISESGTVDVSTLIGDNIRFARAFFSSEDFNSYFDVYVGRQEGGPWIFQSEVGAQYSNGPYYSEIMFESFGGTTVPVQPNSVVFDSLGIRQADFNPNNYVRFVPYWHYAE